MTQELTQDGDRVSALLFDEGGKSRHLGLLHMFARYYEQFGLEKDDLIQHGYVGLVKAAKRFDAARGVAFITYAKFAVKREMNRALIRHLRLENRRTSFQSLLEDKARRDEMREDGGSIHAIPSTLEIPVDETPYTLLEKEDRANWLREAFAKLPEREAEYLRLHFWGELSLSEIARQKSFSKSYVRKVVHQGFANLRALLAEPDRTQKPKLEARVVCKPWPRLVNSPDSEFPYTVKMPGEAEARCFKNLQDAVRFSIQARKEPQ